MNINLQFSPEIEVALKLEAEKSGQDVAEVVAAIVAQRFTDEVRPYKRRRSHQEFLRRLDETIAMHPRSGGKLDDGRESIYGEQAE